MMHLCLGVCTLTCTHDNTVTAEGSCSWLLPDASELLCLSRSAWAAARCDISVLAGVADCRGHPEPTSCQTSTAWAWHSDSGVLCVL